MGKAQTGATEEVSGLGWPYGAVGRSARSVIQHGLVFPILRLVTPVAVRERAALESLPTPVIIAANHVSHLDTPVVLRVLPHRVRRRLVVAAAKDYFYRGRVRGALASLAMATIPFDREEGSSHSLASCESLLRSGWSLLIFPEGTRSPTGELGRVRRGVAVLAVDTGTPVVPLFVHGLATVMPKGRVAPLPGGVVVDVGDALRPVEGEDIESFRDRVDGALHALAAHRPQWGVAPAHRPAGP